MVISREQSMGMKGYAILLIMIHNFVDHILVMGNNEMAYSSKATAEFVASFHAHPSVWQFFSFVGWIGVALFLFVSGYGLTKKYGNGTMQTRHYITSHVTKLWALLAPVYILYVLVQLYLCGEPHNWQSVVTQLSFTINLLSYGDNGFVIEPGVYWFFGVILQFYLLFLILRRCRLGWLIAALAMAIATHYGFLYLADDDTMWWFRQNCIGWGAPFILGMIAARASWQPSRGQLAALLLISIPALFMCLTVKGMAPFTEVCTILLFGSMTLLVNLKPINAVGLISASIFVIHPFVRMVLYKVLEGSTLSVTIMVIIYLLLVAALSLLHYWVFRRLPRQK